MLDPANPLPQRQLGKIAPELEIVSCNLISQWHIDPDR